MERIAEKITQWLRKNHYITRDQMDWCHYMVVQRIMNLVSFCILVSIGALVVGWGGSLAYVLTFRFLRRRTGGYHAKTPHGCLLLSIGLQFLITYLGTLITDTVTSFSVLFLSCASIALHGPANHPALHLTHREVKALYPKIHLCLAITFLVYLFFCWRTLVFANCIAMATFSVAVFLPIPCRC